MYTENTRQERVEKVDKGRKVGKGGEKVNEKRERRRKREWREGERKADREGGEETSGMVKWHVIFFMKVIALISDIIGFF